MHMYVGRHLYDCRERTTTFFNIQIYLFFSIKITYSMLLWLKVLDEKKIWTKVVYQKYSLMVVTEKLDNISTHIRQKGLTDIFVFWDKRAQTFYALKFWL